MRQSGGFLRSCVSAAVLLQSLLWAAEAGFDYPVKPVSFHKVHVHDGFWLPPLTTNRKPYALRKCEETGRIRNFEKAAGLLKGKHEGIYFNDSGVYKVMEGAAYSLQVCPDSMVRLFLERLIAIMAAAQWEDGYLYTFYSVPRRQLEKRWSNIRSLHELYCMGHMYEAAVAHYLATGKRNFLTVALKSADCVAETFAPGRRTDLPGHEEIEIALCKLYRATGNQKYLKLAKFFLDQRRRRHRELGGGKILCGNSVPRLGSPRPLTDDRVACAPP